jgi:hypothetical protein
MRKSALKKAGLFSASIAFAAMLGGASMAAPFQGG